MGKTLLLYLTAVTLFTLVLFWPVTLHIRDSVVNVIDPLFYAWNLSHNADHWFNGFDALVNTNIFYPLTNTIAYSDTLWGQSLFINPVIWITHNPILAQNIAVLLSFPLSALAMFLLSYYCTRNKMASFLSGVFYAFSYPRLSQVGHLPMISSQWLPLYILYLFKFLDDRTRRNFFLVCIWYVLSITSSIYFGIFLIPVTVIMIALDFVKHLYRHTVYQYKNTVIAILPVIVPFIILVGIVLFPYIRLKVENPDIKRTIDDVTHLRANVTDYISVLPTSLNIYKLPTNTNEHVLFPTITVLLLAVTGLVTSYKRNRYMVSIIVLIAFVSFVLSLGNEQRFTIGSYITDSIKLPYYYLYTIFPMFQMIRVPARFGIFVIIALSILAAWGIDYIMKKSKPSTHYLTVGALGYFASRLSSVPRSHKRGIRVLGKSLWMMGIFLCLFIFEIWQTTTPFVMIPLEQSIPDIYMWIRDQPEPMILAELPVSLSFYYGNSMEDQLYRSYTALRKPDVYALETYRMYFSSFHKKRMINGYSGFSPESYNRLVETLENFPSEVSIKALQDIGVTHAVLHIQQYEEKKRNEIIQALTNASLLTLTYSRNDDLVYTINKKQ